MLKCPFCDKPVDITIVIEDNYAIVTIQGCVSMQQTMTNLHGNERVMGFHIGKKYLDVCAELNLVNLHPL